MNVREMISRWSPEFSGKIINLETSVGIECCEISIGCVTYVGANLFARKRLIMRINSHLQSGQQRFLGLTKRVLLCNS